MTTKLRARFDGHALIPLDPVNLPTGQVLEIEVSEAPSTLDQPLRPGSPQALLHAMRQLPHLSKADVDELERAIEDHQMPPTDENIFGDDKAE